MRSAQHVRNKLDNQGKASLQELENAYPEQTTCLNKEVDSLIDSSKDTSIRITGEPNTGKRILTLRTIKKHDDCLHVVATSLNRTSINPQLQEFVTAGAEGVYKVTRKTDSVEEAAKEIRDAIDKVSRSSSWRKVIVHIDELDYGSGVGQRLESIINLCQDHRKVQVIYTSATPFEIDFSDVDPVEVSLMPYLKNTDFYGATNVLADSNFVDIIQPSCWLRDPNKAPQHYPDPLVFSDSFQDYLRRFGNSDFKRTILRANRLVEGWDDSKKNTRKLLLKYRHFFENWVKQFDVEKVKFPAETDDVDWETGNTFEAEQYIEGKILYVVHSTIKRSTDIANKETFFGFYDSPGVSTPITTSVQSITRLNNWVPSPYFVYGDVEALKVAAGQKAPSDVSRDLSGRTGTQREVNPPVDVSVWDNWSDFKTYMKKHGFWKNSRKHKVNDWKSKIQNGEFIEDTLKTTKVLPIDYVEKNRLHGIGSGRQNRGADHRYYVCYEDMTDPSSWRIVTVRRKKGSVNVTTKPETSGKSVYTRN